jgi:hypothetical protein
LHVASIFRLFQGAVSSVIVGTIIATVCVETPMFYEALLAYVEYCNTVIAKQDTSPIDLESERSAAPPSGSRGGDDDDHRAPPSGDVDTMDVGSGDDTAYDTSADMSVNNNNSHADTLPIY